jgi:hypothetical protein
MKTLLIVAGLFVNFAAQSNADVVLNFERFAPPGGLTNVNPSAPYREQGFTLTPSNADSAVFDAAAFYKFPGDNTSWFGFAADNPITLTGPAPFDLDSMLIGPSTIGIGTISFAITGHVFGGGTVTSTFLNLRTATEEVIGFRNLQDAVFFATSDTGIDNIAVAAAVPEPQMYVPLLLTGLFVVLMAKRARGLPKTGHS